MSAYKNPYSPIDSLEENAFFGREATLSKLDGYLVNVDEPSCVSIVAERGVGGPSTVHQFLKSRADKLQYRIVECDIKSDLGRGATAADFYRALIRLLRHKIVNLPDRAHRAANRLEQSKSHMLDDIEKDLWEFFQSIRASGPPLLLVFYSFDRLPHYFQFGELDWNFLREFHNCPDLRVYYLVVSRRPLTYIETLHRLARSLFSTIFPHICRIGLLCDHDAQAMVTQPIQAVSDSFSWDWLAKNIYTWGGRNPYCIRYICFDLFERKWNQQEQFSPSDTDRIARSLVQVLRPYFDRLYANLEADKLIEPLVYAVEVGYSASLFTSIQDLCDLGYFLPELAEQKKYVLFSPLFYDYLIQRGVLKGKEDDTVVALSQQPLFEPLSERELEVLRLIAAGLTNREIAEEMVISVNTVKTHSEKIYSKLSVHKRIEAVDRARELGLL